MICAETCEYNETVIYGIALLVKVMTVVIIPLIFELCEDCKTLRKNFLAAFQSRALDSQKSIVSRFWSTVLYNYV